MRTFWIAAALAGCGGSGDDAPPGIIDLSSLIRVDLNLIFSDMVALADASAGLPDPQPDPTESTTPGPGSCSWAWVLDGTPQTGSFLGEVSAPCGGLVGTLDVELLQGTYQGGWQIGVDGVLLEATGGRKSTATLDDAAANSSLVLSDLGLTVVPGTGTSRIRSGFLKMTYLGYSGGERIVELTVTDGEVLGNVQGVAGTCRIEGSIDAPTVTC